MTKRKLTFAVSLIVIAAFLLGACAPAATATTTSTEATETTQISTVSDASNTAASDTSVSNASTASGAGAPPNGAGNPPPSSGNGGASAEEGLASATGVYTLDGGAATLTGQTYTASETDQSGVYVINGAELILSDSTIITSGNTSSDENSSFYGLNAGVLAASASTIDLSNSSITTSGTGANGVFATGAGSSINLTNVNISATGDGGHGVMATQDGSMTLTNVAITTSGAHSAPVATDRGGGTITTTGDILVTSGQDSPCYYSTGTITASNAKCDSTRSEVAVIEGANSVNLTDSTLTSSVADKWAVMIYQSFSGDAEGTEGVFSMTGGSLSYTASNGPLFYVTNSTGTINLTGVDVSVSSGTLVEAGANDRWGRSGSNGGTVLFTADAQSLTGNMVADNLSAITVTLQTGSSLTGYINSGDTAKEMNLTLDESSVWTVTADSHLTCLTDPQGISGLSVSNIMGNGFTIYYDNAACPDLGGQTYTLNGGGYLKPAN